MRNYRLIALAMTLFAGVATADGAEPMAEIEDLRAELQALREQVNTSSCYEACCDPCCRSTGFTAGAEVSWIKPHSSMGQGAFIPVNFDGNAATRFWVGYSAGNGLGLRARYWDFDHGASGIDPLDPDFSELMELDLAVFDLEVTDVTELGCNWDVMVTGGYRHVDYAEDHSIFDLGTLDFGQAIHSGTDGVTASVELRRHWRNNLTLFGNVRGSALFGGENEWEYDGAWSVTWARRDTLKYMWEAQLGVEWNRPLANGGKFFVRGAAEAQYWDCFSGEPFFDGGEAIGFVGGTFATGIQR